MPTLEEASALRRAGKLAGWACATCQRTTATPMIRCTCGGERIALRELPPEGVVESYTIPRVSAAEWIRHVPYAWAVVKLADGTRVSGWIGGIAAPGDLRLGERVRFDPGSELGLKFARVAAL